jgi:ABC-type multidrug transport system fused ATPase/permease subunit
MKLFNAIKNCRVIIKDKNNKFIILIFFSTVVPFLEIINLSLLLPIFESLVNSSSLSNYSNYVKNIYSFLGINFNVVNLLIIVALFLFFKISINFIYLKLFHNFIENIRVSWTTGIVQNILFHENNTTNSILLETRKSQSAIKSLVQIFSSSITLTFTVVILLFISKELTIFTIIFFLVILIIFGKYISNYSINVGTERRRLDNYFANKVNYILSGFKQIRIFNIENKILNDYKENIEYYGKIYANFRFISQSTRPFLEILILIIFIFIFIYFTQIENKDLKIVIPLLGTFLIISSRLANSLQSCISSYILLLGNTPSVINVKENLQKENEIEKNKSNQLPNDKNISFQNKIEFKNVSFNYGKKKIFNNLNFTILKRDKIEIKSPSGHGKSTMLDLMMGLLNPSSGSIFIDEKNISNFNHKQIFGYVTQETFLFKDTIKNNILMFRKDYENTEIEKIINICCLDSLINKFNLRLNHLLDEGGLNLSGGQRQRIGLARALISNPKVLILDEATNSLDEDLENKIFKNISLNFTDITIISVTHKPKSLWSDKIFDLNENI